MENTSKFSIRSILLASLVSTVLLFGGTFVAGWFQLQQMRDAHMWVSHSYKVVHEIERLICLVKDEEGAQVALILAGDKKIARFDNDLIKNQFAKVKKLVSLGTKQSGKLDNLQSKITRQILAFHENLKEQESRSKKLQGLALLQESKKGIDEIDQELIHLQDDEVKLLENRIDASRKSAEKLQATFVFISAVALILFVTLIFALSRYLSEKEKAAITDDLTGLHNRRGFNLFISQILKTTKRNNWEFGLCFIDMDGLKSINDLHGHGEGSRALSAVAQAIKNAFREEDLIARWGGDEFVVAGVFKNKPSENELKRRLHFELSKKQIEQNFPFELKASIGIKTLVPSELTLERVSNAIEEADENMYISKRLSKLSLSQCS